MASQPPVDATDETISCPLPRRVAWVEEEHKEMGATGARIRSLLSGELPPQPPAADAEPAVAHDAQRDVVRMIDQRDEQQEAYGESMWSTQGTGSLLPQVRPSSVLPFARNLFGQSFTQAEQEMFNNDRSGADNLRMLRNNQGSVEKNYEVEKDATLIAVPSENASKRKNTMLSKAFEPMNNLNGSRPKARTYSSKQQTRRADSLMGPSEAPRPEKRAFVLTAPDASPRRSKRQRQSPAPVVDLVEANSDMDSQLGRHVNAGAGAPSQSHSSSGSTVEPWSSKASQTRFGPAHPPHLPNGVSSTVPEYLRVQSIVQLSKPRNRASKSTKTAQPAGRPPLGDRVQMTPPSQREPARPTEAVELSDDESAGKQESGAQQTAKITLPSSLGKQQQGAGLKASRSVQASAERRVEGPRSTGNIETRSRSDLQRGTMSSERRAVDSTKSPYFPHQATKVEESTATDIQDIVFNQPRPKATPKATSQRQALAERGPLPKGNAATPAEATRQPQSFKLSQTPSDSDESDVVPVEPPRTTRSATKKHTEGGSRGRLEEAFQSSSVSTKGNIAATQFTKSARDRSRRPSSKERVGHRALSSGATLRFDVFGIIMNAQVARRFQPRDLKDSNRPVLVFDDTGYELRFRKCASDDPDDDVPIVGLRHLRMITYAPKEDLRAILHFRTNDDITGPIWVHLSSATCFENLLMLTRAMPSVRKDARTGDHVRKCIERYEAEGRKIREVYRSSQGSTITTVQSDRALRGAGTKRAIEEPTESTERPRKRRNDEAEHDNASSKLHVEPPTARSVASRLSPQPLRRSARSQKPSLQIASFAQEDALARQRTPSPQPQKYSKVHGLPDKWAVPVVYPTQGIRKATVDWVDLERLDEGEFLNDNIISFYLRYLEHQLEQTNPEQLKRIYMFNTFFYDRLVSNRRRAKTVNYDAVSKWTSKVDIFSFDFVIVPINESAHWYLAVLCNLPKLLKDPVLEEIDDIKTDDVAPPSVASKQGTDSSSPLSSPPLSINDKEDPEAPQLVQSIKETGQGVANITISDHEEATDVPQPTPSDGALPSVESLIDKRNGGVANAGGTRRSNRTAEKFLEVFQSAPTKPEIEKEDNLDEDDLKMVVRMDDSKKSRSGPKRKHKPQPPVKRIGVDKPAIIILDSFGMSHSETVRNLKEYLVMEAKAKLGKHVDAQSISGMTAKYIPQQTNFCDCGLFLLGYMEKFLQDPQLLVQQLLQKTPMDEQDWPKMNASTMRDEIREILIGLGKEQEDARRAAHREAAKQRGKYHEKKGEGKEKVKKLEPPKTPLRLAASSAPPAPQEKDQGSSTKKANAMVRTRHEKTPELSVSDQPEATGEIVAPPQQASAVVLRDSHQISNENEKALSLTPLNESEQSVVRESPPAPAPPPSRSATPEGSPKKIAKAALLCIKDSQESAANTAPTKASQLTIRISEIHQEAPESNQVVPMTAPEAHPTTPLDQSQTPLVIQDTP